MSEQDRPRGQFDELDGYRGLAATMVTIDHTHAAFLAGFGLAGSGGILAGLTIGSLDVGVDWFFALSGFLIFLPFARACITQRARPALRAFFTRRAARIIPAYYLAFVATWLITFQGRGDEWRNLLAHLTFTHIFSEHYIFATIGPGWSVAAEMIYYLAIGASAPLLYALCGRYASPRPRAALLLGLAMLIAAISIGYKGWYWVRADHHDLLSVYFGPLARGDGFAFGMALAVILAVAPQGALLGGAAARRLRRGALLVTAAAFLARPLNPLADVYFHTICGLAFTAILASTLLAPTETRWARAMTHPALRYIGTVSYGIYLWHGPLLDNLITRGLPLPFTPWMLWPTIAVVIGLSLAIASISYFAIERPILRRARGARAAHPAPSPASRPAPPAALALPEQPPA